MRVISNDQLMGKHMVQTILLRRAEAGCRMQQESHITFVYQDFASAVFQSFELQDHFKQVGIGQLYDTQHVHNY